jgi:hypothetical protein
MSLSFNRDVVYVLNVSRRRDFRRPHINYIPTSPHRQPYNLRFREPYYHPEDMIVGDYLQGYQLADILN